MHKDDDPAYGDFSEEIRERRAIADIVRHDGSLQAAHSAFMEKLEGWWVDNVGKIEALAPNVGHGGNVYALRRDLLGDIDQAFGDQALLNPFQVRGGLARYVDGLKADLKSIAASGWGAELIPAEAILESQFPDVMEERRAKASEMEHAIRKHCTIRFDEDPAFYRRMSEKLDSLIERHGEEWSTLAERYEELRFEIRAGRSDDIEEGEREVAVFRENLYELADKGDLLAKEDTAEVDKLAERLVSMIRSSITIVDFWRKPDEVKRLRAHIDTELVLSGLDAVQADHQRIAVELTKLAEKRHEELVRP